MRWRIRRIVNGCAAQKLVDRRDVIAPVFISYGIVICAINRKVCLKQAYRFIQADAASRHGLIQALCVMRISDMWTKFRVREPVWAYIYDTTVVYLQETRTTCQLSRFAEPKIEPEIVLRFNTAPQVEAGLIGVLNAIGWVAHGFEIVQSHFPGWKFQAPDTVAD